MSTETIGVEILAHAFTDNPYTFAKAKPGDAGYDLAAAYSSYMIGPGESVKVACGVKLAIPEGYFGQVVMRSGHGFKKSLSCHIGTVDEGYRGELFVMVRNHGKDVVILEQGERFAQIIFHQINDFIVALGPVDENTARGASGFGSSG